MIPWTIDVIQFMMDQLPDCYTDIYHATSISKQDVVSNNHVLYDMETFPRANECLRDYGVIRGDNIEVLPPIFRVNTVKKFLNIVQGCLMGA